MDDYSRGLSLRLYDVMERVGASERMRKLYQDTSITKEIIDTTTYLTKNVNASIYTFGSSCEGTTTQGLDSDIDIVNCDDEWPVIDNIHEAPAHGQVFLMVRDDHTYPGYAKLQLVDNAWPLTIFGVEIINNNDRLITDNNGRICRKHNTLIRTDNFNQYLQRHGPADTPLPLHGMTDQDLVFAHRCKKIPVFANEWIGRRRYYEWPSRDHLIKMSSLGCFVVGVGHPSSHEYPIEWRLSFSLQERELMFSLNPTQHKCYILLKIVKKDIIEKFVGKSICSYHCKTCLFYTIENTTADIWRPDNLCYCLSLCLYVLWVWVYDGNCPNYFVPEENMFDRHELMRLRKPLLLVLYGLLNDGYGFLFYLECDNIGHILMNRAGFQLYRQVVQHAYNKKTSVFSALLYFRNSLYEMINVNNDDKQSVLMLSNMLQHLMNVRTITEHTEQQSKEAVSYVIPLVHLQLAQHLVVLAFTVNDNFVIRQLIQLSDFHFRQGSNIDLMSARLMIATVLFRFRYYDMCEQILDTIGMDVTAKVLSLCFCYPKEVLNTNGLMEMVCSRENMSAKSICRTSVATCVQFTPSQMEIIPPPLRLEMYRSVDTPPGSRDDTNLYWFDRAVVDGKVYTYFLQYLVFSKLNKHNQKHVAIENMKWVIQDDPNLRHTETAYNLLGWIYTQENRVKDAIQCFLESWRIRPYHNAAKWHIRKLMFGQ